MSQDVPPAALSLALHLGDNCLVLGQQVSAWCGHGPALEEDLALTNTALDLIGQARHWLDLAGALEGAGHSADDLAFHRDIRAFRNCLLVEQPNGDFADTMLRQFLFDQWQLLALADLAESQDPGFAGIAARACKEVRYHLERSSRWVRILGGGTAESHRRAGAAASRLWPYTGELFETREEDRQLDSAGVRFDPSALSGAWHEAVESILDAAGLPVPETPFMQSGGRSGIHGEHLGHLLDEMQSLPRAHAGSTW